MATKLKFSRQFIHKLVEVLLEERSIEKTGSIPHVYYHLAIQNKNSTLNNPIDPSKEQFLKAHLLIVDAVGNLLNGLEAMQYWCGQQNLSLHKTIDEYIETRKKYLKFYDKNLIDGQLKLKSTQGLGEIGVDALYYLDFYVIEQFGKTKLGTLIQLLSKVKTKI